MCGYQQIVSFFYACRADCSNSTNLNLTRVSVRFSGSSPEASFGFLSSGSQTSKRMGTTFRCRFLATDQYMVFRSLTAYAYTPRVDLVDESYEP